LPSPWGASVSPIPLSNDNIGNDEQRHGHGGGNQRDDGEDLEERPEISRCRSLFGVCFTNARFIFVKVVEERSRFSHFVVNDFEFLSLYEEGPSQDTDRTAVTCYNAEIVHG